MLIDVYRLLVNCYLDVKYEFLGGMRFPKGSGAGPGGSGKPCHGCETSKDNWIPHMTANETLYWVCNGRYIIMWYLHREIPRAPGSLMRRPVSTVDLLLWKVVHSYQAIYLTRSTYFFNLSNSNNAGLYPSLEGSFFNTWFHPTESREPSTRPPSQPALPTSRRRARRKRCPNLFLAKFKVQRASDKGRCTLAWKKQSMQTILSSFDDYSNPFTKHKQELCLRGSAKFSISILEGTHGQEKQNQGGNKHGTVPVVLPCQLKCMESIFWTLYDARSWAIRMKILHRPSITSFLRKPCATLPLT